jgi:signal transduction histidine kinase
MIREETEVAERIGPMVDANFSERPGFARGLKSEGLDHWARRFGLWSRKITLFQQFVIYAFVILGLTMIAVGTWMSARIADGALRSNAAAAALYMGSFVEPHIQSIDDGGPLSSDDLVNLDKISGEFVLRRRVMSIKIWQLDGTILFSSRKDLIGRKFSNLAIQPSLKGDISVGIATLDDDDSEFERRLAVPLYEIFAPLYKNGTGKIIAVAEFYQSADELVDETTTVRNSWLIVGGASLGMFIALFAIVYRGSAKIDQQRSLLKRKLREQAILRRTNSQLEKNMRDALTESARIDDLIQRRLGVELHDGPAQLVSLVLLRLDEIKNASEGTSASADIVDNLRGVAADALKDIRSISNGLFLPSVDGTNNLVEVLAKVINAHERRTNSVVALSVSDVPEYLPVDIIRCVGRVVQEALNNSFKHAGSASQAVSAVVTDHELILSIRDSGPGIGDSNSPVAEKLGLRGMKYRVAAVGGVFELKSQQGIGTEVWCKIPLATLGQAGLTKIDIN